MEEAFNTFKNSLISLHETEINQKNQELQEVINKYEKKIKFLRSIILEESDRAEYYKFGL